MKTLRRINKIFKLAKSRNLKDVSIKIQEDFKCILYVGNKDRWECDNLKILSQALSEHKEDLSWMNK